MTNALRDMPTTRPTLQYQEPYQDFLQRIYYWETRTRQVLMEHPDTSRYEWIVKLRTAADDLQETNKLLNEPDLAHIVDDINLIADQLDELIRALISEDNL